MSPDDPKLPLLDSVASALGSLSQRFVFVGGDEVVAARHDLRIYLADRSATLLAEPQFVEALPGHLPGDESRQARVPIILERLRRILHVSQSSKPLGD